MFNSLVLIHLVWQEQEAAISRLFPGFVLIFRGDFRKYLWKLPCDLEICMLFSKVMQAFWSLEPPETRCCLHPYELKGLLPLLSPKAPVLVVLPDYFQLKTQDMDSSITQRCGL